MELLVVESGTLTSIRPANAAEIAGFCLLADPKTDLRELVRRAGGDPDNMRPPTSEELLRKAKGRRR